MRLPSVGIDRGLVNPPASAERVQTAIAATQAPPTLAAAAIDNHTTPAATGAAIQSLPLMPTPSAFEQRFGTSAPLSVQRSPLATLLQDLTFPEDAAGLAALWKWLTPTATSPASDELTPAGFDTLKTALDARVADWASQGGSYADLKRLRTLERFVRCDDDPPWPATIGFGPTIPATERRPVAGIPLEVTTGVSAQAAAIAETIVQQMLSPAVAARMAAAKAVLVIVPVNALLTDVMPSLRGILTADGRSWDTVRGVADVYADQHRHVSLPEENLLHDAKHDPQAATYSTAVHEIAHMVLSVGVSDADRKAITTHYVEQSRGGKGAFTDDYASTNVDEYFAQATCAYFGVNKGQGKDLAFLQAEDPWIVGKLGEIYGPPPHAQADRV
jgi:hypothetical protein